MVLCFTVSLHFVLTAFIGCCSKEVKINLRRNKSPATSPCSHLSSVLIPTMQFITVLSLVRWNVSLLHSAPPLLYKMCLSWTIMSAMNSAMCQKLTQAASTKLAVVCPENRNRPTVTVASPQGCTDLCSDCTCGQRSCTWCPMSLLSSSFNSEDTVSNPSAQEDTEDINDK